MPTIILQEKKQRLQLHNYAIKDLFQANHQNLNTEQQIFTKKIMVGINALCKTVPVYLTVENVL